jgi:hypothetical protein
LPDSAESREISEKVPRSWEKLPDNVKSCEISEKVPRSPEKLPDTAESWEILDKVTTSRQKLPHLGKSCRISETVDPAPKKLGLSFLTKSFPHSQKILPTQKVSSSQLFIVVRYHLPLFSSLRNHLSILN